jgi:hypothetical protein
VLTACRGELLQPRQGICLPPCPVQQVFFETKQSSKACFSFKMIEKILSGASFGFETPV